MTRRALDLLGSRRNDAYEAALAELREDTRELVGGHAGARSRRAGRGRGTRHRRCRGPAALPEDEVLPWFEARKKELANRPLIREQAFGEALDPDKLERLGRYEVHLDRKLERMLAMLLRLKDLRAGDESRADPFGKISVLHERPGDRSSLSNHRGSDLGRWLGSMRYAHDLAR